MLALPLRGSTPELYHGKYVAGMFGAGEQGAWYDPSDLSTMYKDAAGTIPVTAVGQPVGKILDKSGRGNHATQSTTASRPTLQIDTAGNYFLSFDGVDDSLVTGNINFSATDKMTVFSADVSQWDNATRGIVGLTNSVYSIGGTFWLTSFDTAYSAYSVAYLRGGLNGLRGAGSYGPDQRTLGLRRLVRSVKYDLSKTTLAEEISVRLNGVSQAVNSLLDPSAGNGNFGNWPLYIGRTGSSYPFSGRLYGLIVRGAQTDDAHLTHAEKYLAYKSGVSL